jgi:ketosteroid isomerase-like protein
MRRCAAGILALLASGCGTTDADRVRSALDDYAQAVAHRDARALCRRILAPDLVSATERATGRRCEMAVRALVGERAPRVAGATVRVDGLSATARLGRQTLVLVKTGAGWRLASLGNDGGPIRP